MCRCRGRVARLFLGRAAFRAEASDDRHINMDRLIRDYRERLRSDAQALVHASFDIENVSAWRKRSAIISVSVRSNARDLLSLSLAQNDQRIISVVFRCYRGRVFTLELNRSVRTNVQASLNETLGRGVHWHSADQN